MVRREPSPRNTSKCAEDVASSFSLPTSIDSVLLPQVYTTKSESRSGSWARGSSHEYARPNQSDVCNDVRLARICRIIKSGNVARTALRHDEAARDITIRCAQRHQGDGAKHIAFCKKAKFYGRSIDEHLFDAGRDFDRCFVSIIIPFEQSASCSLRYAVLRASKHLRVRQSRT